jgi:hypothetical protein
MKKPPFRLGTYPLGHENVELWVEPPDADGSCGGWFCLQGDNGHPAGAHIQIAADSKWDNTIHLLLHETREFLCCRLGLRFRSTSSYNGNSAACMYVYDHQQGAEMDQAQATFLSYALPPLGRAHAKLTTPKGKRRKGRK